MEVRKCFGLLAALCGLAITDAVGQETDPFEPYLTGKAPEIIEVLHEKTVDGVALKEVHFLSRTVETDSGAIDSKIFALIARPEKEGQYPGLLVLHGGGGEAEADKAIRWAKRGYIVLTLDIPGIMNAQKKGNSFGHWSALEYGDNQFIATPDITHSVLFDGIVAVVQGLYLLHAQPGVKKGCVGVSGISWGGYAATMVTGLANEYVDATFSIYGSGYYDEGSAFEAQLDRMGEADKNKWLKYLDAGRRSHQIRTPYFIAAATNDRWFYPPAVMATLRMVGNHGNHLFSPNTNHRISVPGGSDEPQPTGWLKMEDYYFRYHLKGTGSPFPVLENGATAVEDGKVVFDVKQSTEIKQALVYYNIDDEAWPEKKWIEVQAVVISNGLYEAVLPKEFWEKGGYWFPLIWDSRPFTVSGAIEKVSPK